MRIMRRLALAAGVALAAVAVGDTVHMRDGRKFVGKVTREAARLKIEMAYGTITVDEVDVLIVLSGGTTQPVLPTTWASPAPRRQVRVQPVVRWNMNQATLPEPIVLMLARQLELLRGTCKTPPRNTHYDKSKQN